MAGVHYRNDNIVGLNMGQAIVADRLADYLADEFGANRTAAVEKIARMRFDWNDFVPETCDTGVSTTN